MINILQRIILKKNSHIIFESYATRPEQYKLRNYLIKNKEHKCIICNKYYPLYLLECAHIKPRYIADEKERLDYNIVQWMCRNCHKIYDSGDIGIKNKKIYKTNNVLHIISNNYIDSINYNNSIHYFNFHFNNFYLKNISKNQ